MAGTVFYLLQGADAYGNRASRNVEKLLAEEIIARRVAIVANGRGAAYIRP